MFTFLWSPLPVFMLTLRQFSGGRATRVVALISLIPVLLAAIYALVSDGTSTLPEEFFAEGVFRGLFVATLLPVAVMVLATGALGNEVEDQTLPYLSLKPIRRIRIVFEKFLASVVAATPLILGGMAIAYVVTFRGDAGDSVHLTYLWSALAASFAGIVAYSAVFQLVSLLVARALLVGLTYSLVWESVLGRYLPGLKIISIRHYTESIFVGMLEKSNYPSLVQAGNQMSDPTAVGTSAIVIVVVAIVAMLISTWRLGRLNLE
ncbi:MAG: ABC transporter permease [Thermomicrobiales bacterium]|jgi:ABC-2 type transport system permease protein|nr:ABC transporter permease [Thermomicrobiales bacterium]